MNIVGKAKFISREKVKPPKDGVHVAGADGWLKGTHCVYFGDKLVPKGRVSFYWQKTEDTGVKVYYSFAWNKTQNAKYVRFVFKKMKALARLGICPQPEKIVDVKLDISHRGKRFRGHAIGLKVDHVRYPVDAWTAYAHGKPYDWNCLDQEEHPKHNPHGFLEFRRWAKKKMKDKHLSVDGSMKLGDVSYDMAKKCWLLVDVD